MYGFNAKLAQRQPRSEDQTLDFSSEIILTNAIFLVNKQYVYLFYYLTKSKQSKLLRLIIENNLP